MLQCSRVQQKHQNEFTNGRKSLLTVKKALNKQFNYFYLLLSINIIVTRLLLIPVFLYLIYTENRINLSDFFI